MTEEEKRLQLVVDRSTSTRPSFIGFGLLASLALGFGQLSEAASGAGSFEGAIGRFLLVAGACAFGGAVLGRLLDGAGSKQELHSARNNPMEDQRQRDVPTASSGESSEQENR